MTNLRLILVFLFLNLSGLAAFAQSTLVYDSSISIEAKAEFESDLKFLGSIKGTKSSPLHKKIFGEGTLKFPLDGNLYSQYFFSRISSIRLDQDPTPYNAYVDPIVNPHEMVITSNYKKYDDSIISRLDTLIHEARHSEPENYWWSHVACPAADVDGNPITGNGGKTNIQGYLACDNSAYGAYGVSVIFLYNIANFCESCSSEMRDEARFSAGRYLTRIVNPAAHQLLLDDAAYTGN